MTTVYDAFQERCDYLARHGRPATAEIARHFEKPGHIDRALGLTSAAAHWYSGRNNVSNVSEGKCRAWLDANVKAAPVAADASALLLVTCPPGIAAKAAKVLAVLGCEAVEV